MKILHLASFDGNIGDNASHLGFRKILSTVLQGDYSVDQLEVRKFYNNYSLADKHRFDSDFAALANGYDLLFIGGGGFLDFDIPNSITGTTIGISKQVLDEIKAPIIISSIGANPRNLIPEGNIEKFKAFLDDFLPRKNTFLAVRNDGSKQALLNLVGSQYADAIPEVLDHGFFYENDGSFYTPTEKKYIAINTTSDQVLMVNKTTGKIDPELYLGQMSNVINHIIHETDYDIVFAPHIYSDFKAIDQLLKNINDFYIRTRVVITPYVQGNYGCNQIFSAYKNSSLALGMRFHANVCCMAMDTPSVGIAALERVVSVYNSLGLGNCVINADSEFSNGLIEKISTMPGTKPLTGDVAVAYKQKTAFTLNSYKEVLTNWGLI